MKRKKEQGFTLVELIVVLVILAILAAILTPALLGYIDRAKDQQLIVEAKELMTAAQAGIVEAYALEKKQFEDYVNKKGCPEVTEEFDYVSSHLFASKQGTVTSSSTAAKDIIAKRLIEYTDSRKGKEKRYTFCTTFMTDGSFDISTLKKGEVAFVILYNKRGRILYMQYARDGKLVTYDGKKKAFSTQTGGKIVKHAKS